MNVDTYFRDELLRGVRGRRDAMIAALIADSVREYVPRVREIVRGIGKIVKQYRRRLARLLERISPPRYMPPASKTARPFSAELDRLESVDPFRAPNGPEWGRAPPRRTSLRMGQQASRAPAARRNPR